MKVKSEIDKSQRVGVEEKYIKFRSSPNFKNMKKFLKSKIDYIETPAYGSPENGSTASSSSNSSPNNIQPPLPLHPPPPDSPAKDKNFDVDVKHSLAHPEIVSKTEKPDEPEDCEVLEETISIKVEPHKPEPCRDFIRGTCTRPDCKYLHEYDLSHLYRVYTFCRNYQNSICTLPNCRYAHATVFEEQAFYRTGILPPHALAHHKNNSNNNNNNNNANNVPNSINKSFVFQPPPPPPLPPATVPVPVTATVPVPVPLPVPVVAPVPIPVAEPEKLPPHLSMNMTPAASQIGVEVKSFPIMNCMTPATNNSNGLKDALIGSASPNLKRTWSEQEEFIATQCGLEANAKRPNKCNNCIRLENRLQYTKEKIENMTKSSMEFDEKITEMEKKSSRLLACILSVVKPEQSNTEKNDLGAFHQNLNFSEDFPIFQDQDKVNIMADQLKQLIQSRMTKFNSEEKTLKAFQMSASNNVQSNQSSVNLANVNSTRQLENLFNSWGNRP